jgi:hypothetical protein
MSSQSNLRSRLAQLQAQRSAAAGGTLNSSSLFSTPLRGGFDRRLTIQPVVYGEELAFVKDGSSLCLGKIGTGGNLCLKRDSECDVEAHTRRKGELPPGMSLVILKGEERGYGGTVLDADDLDNELIEDLLSRKNVSWPSEFAKIESNSTRTMTDLETVEDVLNTARKHRSFKTPVKVRVTEAILDKISLLDTSHRLLEEVITPQFNEEGESTTTPDFSFTHESYEKLCADVYDKVEVLAENSKCLGDVIIQLQPFIESHTKPMENLISGLRT